MASWIGPTTMITASIAPRIALKRVNTLARMISPSVRLVRSPVSLTCAARDALLHLGRGEAGRRRLAWAAAAPIGASIGVRRARSRRQDVDADERDLAGGVVLEHAVPAELGQPLAAFVGTRSRSARRPPASCTGPRGR